MRLAAVQRDLDFAILAFADMDWNRKIHSRHVRIPALPVAYLGSRLGLGIRREDKLGLLVRIDLKHVVARIETCNAELAVFLILSAQPDKRIANATRGGLFAHGGNRVPCDRLA